MSGFFPAIRPIAPLALDGADAQWTVVNTGTQPLVATLALELSANPAQRLDVRLDGRPLQTVAVEPSRDTYQLGPLTVGPGDHELLFHATTALRVPDEAGNNGDRRQVSFELGTWTWTARSEPR